MNIYLQILTYLAIGSAAGFLSGLLGIGGGLVVVPILISMFDFLDLNVNLMQFATGTSLAVMIFTTFSSSLAHYKKQAIDWYLVKYLSIGIISGAFIGRNISGYIPTSLLGFVFIGFVAYIAIRTFYKKNIEIDESEFVKPNKFNLSVWGLAIGFTSSLLGLGGVLTVPVLLRYNYKTQIAVAAAATCGFMVALTSSANSIATGFLGENLPYSWGCIYLPAFICIAIASFNMAPFGAKVAHKLSSDTLRKLFAVFLLFVILEMTVNVVKNF